MNKKNKFEDNIKRCLNIYRRSYPDVSDPLNHADSICRKYIKDNCNNDSVILDAGAGKENLLSREVNCRVIGIDLLFSSLIENKDINAKIAGDLNKLPFKDETFDFIYSRWVIEHIIDPNILIKEYLRVLKPQGFLLLVTPNILNPAMAVTRFIPHSIKGKILEFLNHKHEEDIFPAFYKANTIVRLNRLFHFHDITVVGQYLIGEPFYFHQKPSLFKLAMLYEKITDYKCLRFLKMHIAIIGKKR